MRGLPEGSGTPLRVALISEHASPVALVGGEDAGGQNVYVNELSRHLGRLGHEVDVFTRRDDPETPEVIEWAENVRVVNLRAGPRRRIGKDAMWEHMPEFRDELLRHVLRTGARYDVIHGNFWMSGWVGVEVGRELRAPLVQTFHALGATKRRWQGADDTSPAQRLAVETHVARHADRVIAHCPEEHRELVEEYGVDARRIALAPPGVDLERFMPVDRREARRLVGLDERDNVIVYVGRIVPRKDVRNVVRALAALLRSSDLSPRLLVVGGEDERPDARSTPEIGELRRLASELGVGERVVLTGKRQPDVLRYYYGAADVVVTTPWYEPFGLTPLEAMACGRPIVAAAVGGIPYTVEDGATGLLVPPQDPAALAAAIGSLLVRPRLRAAMGAAGRRRVEERFSWDRCARRIAAVYRSSLQPAASGAPSP